LPAATIDRPARLVTDEVRIDVACSECPRALEHEPAPNLLLTEGEMAGRRVEDQVDSAGRQGHARPVGGPGVFTDLEPDPHASELESEVSDRQVAVSLPDPAPTAAGPGPEPAGLVVNPVAGEVLLAHDPRQPAIRGDRHGVVHAVLVPDRQADRDRESPGLRENLLEHPPGHPLDSWREERILAAVARDAEFGEAKEGDPVRPGGGDGRHDPVPVPVPVERRLVEGTAPDSDRMHVWRIGAFYPGSSR